MTDIVYPTAIGAAILVAILLASRLVGWLAAMARPDDMQNESQTGVGFFLLFIGACIMLLSFAIGYGVLMVLGVRG